MIAVMTCASATAPREVLLGTSARGGPLRAVRSRSGCWSGVAAASLPSVGQGGFERWRTLAVAGGAGDLHIFTREFVALDRARGLATNRTRGEGMTELLSGLPRLATIVFAVSSMLAVGFSYSLRDIFGPLRRFPRVVRALVANFFVVPLIAYLVTQVLALEGPQAAGLILVGTAAGAPFLIKLTTAAEGDVALSATLLVLLLPATVLLMPFIVPLLLPGTTLSAQVIAVPLVVTMLLPLAVGLLVRARAPGWAE